MNNEETNLRLDLLQSMNGVFMVDDGSEITSSIKPTQDPLAVDVLLGNCGSRLINAALDILNRDRYLLDPTFPKYTREELRLSMFPDINQFIGRRGINRKSLWVYELTMQEHGFHDKLKGVTV